MKSNDDKRVLIRNANWIETLFINIFLSEGMEEEFCCSRLGLDTG